MSLSSPFDELYRHQLILLFYSHVRVRHVDKKKDDPLLQEVLRQRPRPSREEGGAY